VTRTAREGWHVSGVCQRWQEVGGGSGQCAGDRGFCELRSVGLSGRRVEDRCVRLSTSSSSGSAFRRCVSPQLFNLGPTVGWLFPRYSFNAVA
jgi:hypothetical protein